MMPYPWHTNIWQRLCAEAISNRIPHALLLGGRAGFGKRRFADALVGYLLCNERRIDEACGECASCRLYGAGSHPDYHFVAPPHDGKQISVDSIRDCLEFTCLSKFVATHKVVLIQPAEAMNRNASNALLKTLEEPSAETIFVLVSDQPASLLATIRSRCRRVSLDRIDLAQAVGWLRDRIPAQEHAELAYTLAGGAPVLAAEFDIAKASNHLSAILSLLNELMADNDKVLDVSNRFASDDDNALCDVLVRVVETMIYKNFRVDIQSDGIDRYSRMIAESLTSKLDARRLFVVYEMLLRHRNGALVWSGLRERDRVDELFFTLAH